MAVPQLVHEMMMALAEPEAEPKNKPESEPEAEPESEPESEAESESLSEAPSESLSEAERLKAERPSFTRNLKLYKHFVKAYPGELTHRTRHLGTQLGIWVRDQFRAKAANKLNPKRLHKLNAEKTWRWKFDAPDQVRNAMVRAIKKYIRKHGRLPTHGRYSYWIVRQKIYWEKGKLTQEQQNQLRKLPGWRWSSYVRFSIMLKRLKAAKPFPTTGELGAWIQHLKFLEKTNQLSKQRRQKLNKVPGW